MDGLCIQQIPGYNFVNVNPTLVPKAVHFLYPKYAPDTAPTEKMFKVSLKFFRKRGFAVLYFLLLY